MTKANRPPHLRLVANDLDALLLTDDEIEALAREKPQKQSPHRTRKSRQFVRFDAIWAEVLLAADPTVSAAAWRLAVVILAKADFYQQFLVTDTMMAAAWVKAGRKRAALERLERLGLIQVEWRGRGRTPFVTPLLLGGRPHQK